MADVLEIASSGRAKCRGCGSGIDKDTYRFGERAENPFGEGETTYWFHPACAAYRRPERFTTLPPEQLALLPNADELRKAAELGVVHHRLPRIAGLEHAKSARAACRHCKQPIAANTMRIVLSIWEEARFSPAGFVHESCARDYFGTADFDAHLRRVQAAQ